MLDFRFELLADGLRGEIGLGGPVASLGPEGSAWLEEEAAFFMERAVARYGWSVRTSIP